ncbi:MAG: hypothetical protein CMO10_08760 [Thalassospira sp.]|nr:hypothetical protein [Thalassospira sp.]|tara:strand:- start:7630 stop:7959 length:330 start_codon:yes stop_codon:yes gene_type:complete
MAESGRWLVAEILSKKEFHRFWAEVEFGGLNEINGLSFGCLDWNTIRPEMAQCDLFSRLDLQAYSQLSVEDAVSSLCPPSRSWPDWFQVVPPPEIPRLTWSPQDHDDPE